MESPFGPPPLLVAIVVLFFVLTAGAILYAIVQAVTQYIKNKNSPVVQTPACIVAKRSEITQTSNSDNNNNNNIVNNSIRTTYYVTFESTNGARREWEITGEQFGLLVEGDRGVLVTQGTWFKDFVRTVS